MYTMASATCWTFIVGSTMTSPWAWGDADAHALGHRGGGIAYVNLAASYVVLAPVERGGAGYAGHRVLGGCVGYGVGARDVGGEGAVVDDAPAHRLLVLHDVERLLGAEEGAGEVGVDDGHPLVVGEVFEQDGRRAGSGVVEEDVQPSESVFGFGEEVLYRVGVADVDLNYESARAVVAGLGDCFFQGGQASAGEGDGVSVPEQGERGGLAYAGSGARNDCDLAIRCHV